MSRTVLALNVTESSRLALGIAIFGLIASGLSLWLTWRIWRQSGAELHGSLNGRYEPHGRRLHRGSFTEAQVIFDVMVANTGRMPAVLDSAIVLHVNTRWLHLKLLRWWYVIFSRNNQFGVMAYVLGSDGSPRESEYLEIAPTSAIRMRAFLDADIADLYKWAQVLVIRGDGRTFYSKRIRKPDAREYLRFRQLLKDEG